MAGQQKTADKAQLSIRIDLPGGTRIGPGKLALLRAISEEGSIAAAARALGMSYPRAWRLADDLNRGSSAPLIEKRQGGPGSGGAVLTEAGAQVLATLQRIQKAASRATQKDLQRLLELYDAKR